MTNPEQVGDSLDIAIMTLAERVRSGSFQDEAVQYQKLTNGHYAAIQDLSRSVLERFGDGANLVLYGLSLGVQLPEIAKDADETLAAAEDSLADIKDSL